MHPHIQYAVGKRFQDVGSLLVARECSQQWMTVCDRQLDLSKKQKKWALYFCLEDDDLETAQSLIQFLHLRLITWDGFLYRVVHRLIWNKKFATLSRPTMKWIIEAVLLITPFVNGDVNKMVAQVAKRNNKDDVDFILNYFPGQLDTFGDSIFHGLVKHDLNDMFMHLLERLKYTPNELLEMIGDKECIFRLIIKKGNMDLFSKLVEFTRMRKMKLNLQHMLLYACESGNVTSLQWICENLPLDKMDLCNQLYTDVAYCQDDKMLDCFIEGFQLTKDDIILHLPALIDGYMSRCCDMDNLYVVKKYQITSEDVKAHIATILGQAFYSTKPTTRSVKWVLDHFRISK